jgi:hypothetical protein
VAWTVFDAGDLDLATVRTAPGSAQLRMILRDRQNFELPVDVTLEAPGMGVAGAAYLSEGQCQDPRWELAPFQEKWRDGEMVNTQINGKSSRGLLYVAVASHVEVLPRAETNVTLRARVRPQVTTAPVASGRFGGRIESYAPRASPPSAPRVPDDAPPGALSRARWQVYFDSLPRFSCSDPYFERYWYYRWYGLRLCGHEGGSGNHLYPGCCEGTGYFHLPISYSAQCHARELRWLQDPARARGVILNFLAHQEEIGGLHGRIYVNHLQGTDFYFADWGGAVLAVDEVHPDLDFLRAVYPALAHYADWLDRERDADGTGLYDVLDHYETGQEYMSRYVAVSPEADAEEWGQRIRLKGVDVAVYAYRLQRALADIAGRLSDNEAAARWSAAANRTGTAIVGRMWDGDNEIFSDVDPSQMRRTGVKAAVCFYPYFTDLVGRDHVEGLRRHLLNPAEFWTSYPIASTSIDDPYYSADAEWKGKRHNCPWNGRVWPMANSHLVEALTLAAAEHDEGLREPAAQFIRRFIRMMFHEGDIERPNCYEHYNPETGQPSLYRGFDDYQHSWVNDLIIKYVVGFRPTGGDAFVIDPLPFGLKSLRISGLPFRGRWVGIEIAEGRVSFQVDGKGAGTTEIGQPARVEL